LKIAIKRVLLNIKRVLLKLTNCTAAEQHVNQISIITELLPHFYVSCNGKSEIQIAKPHYQSKNWPKHEMEENYNGSVTVYKTKSISRSLLFIQN